MNTNQIGITLCLLACTAWGYTLKQHSDQQEAARELDELSEATLSDVINQEPGEEVVEESIPSVTPFAEEFREPVAVQSRTFSSLQDYLEDSDSPRLVIFTASWCGPCKVYKAQLGDMRDAPQIEFIDIDENPDMWRLGQRATGKNAVPLTCWMQNRRVVHSHLLYSKQQLIERAGE
ncbi:Thioredoxin [Thalassoglobus neptunius]|uniref:Thioredoxin n=1 Tax=Thalassoglobus neptunius TaxID=1938619 RepID=A0A5C5X4V9_9PLAN|nr:thioredoxin family protein [Thalassoglobus neptunius]TWT57235.1 Thioredoxin [Thalassoglobus neptunius]